MSRGTLSAFHIVTDTFINQPPVAVKVLARMFFTAISTDPYFFRFSFAADYYILKHLHRLFQVKFDYPAKTGNSPQSA
jgi:hypothetical protein